MAARKDRLQSTSAAPRDAPHGRGTALRPDSRFARHRREAAEVEWPDEDGAPRTELFVDTAKSVITFNRSPDVPFDRSINPYRGCEHGCIYCYARPSHAFVDLSPGLDFETKIGHKPDAASLLRRELAHPGYHCAPITLGANTDAWQPVERRLAITRAILEVLAETRHPVTIVTKSALIERDLDLLTDLAGDNLVQVLLSVTTLDDALARRMEPRAARPARRLAAMARLAEAGVPVGVLFAPLIPALNDHEMEAVLAAAREAGAESAGYVLLRLPHEIAQLFTDWLERHYPERARHVLSVLAQLRGGRMNDPRFGQRMRGTGPFAELYRQRMHRACARLGLNRRARELDTTRFRAPQDEHPQRSLF
jgi:DNA repair photolyase